MKEFFGILQNCPLFSGVDAAEAQAMLGCLNARKVETDKDTYIFREGDPADFVGVVLSGAVRVVRTDFYGNQSILGQVEPGGVFGEAFSCAGAQALPVSVVAAAGSETGAACLPAGLHLSRADDHQSGAGAGK